jgi:hypothetical protein
MATATATFGFVRQLSTSMSVVLGTVIYQNIMGQQAGKLTAAIGSKLTAEISTSFAGASKTLIETLDSHQKQVVLEAFTLALSRMWIFYACMGGVGFILSCFIVPRVLTKTHTIQKTGLDQQEKARQELIDSQRKAEGKSEADV